MDYQQALDYLFPMVRYGTKLGMDNMEELLSRIGDPHHPLKFIHIAGSKGKGSVAALLSSILKEAGFKVGTFTSPHLVDFTERIRVDWEPIPRDEVVRLVSELKPIAEEISKISRTKSPTFFEMTTAMAFKYFQENNVDLAVVEAGMGGRYDSTNVITPTLAIITHISTEHSEHLGRSLTRIARDKAAVIKENVPAVISEESEFIEKRCKEMECDALVLGRDLKYGRESFDLDGQDFWVEDGDHKRFHIKLLGNYQIQNAATAYAAVRMLRTQGFEIPDDAVRRGFESANWPARLHVIQRNPTVVVDTTHNSDGSIKLVESLEELFSFDKAILVFAALEDKEVDRIAEVLGPFSSTVIASQTGYRKAMHVDTVVKAFKAHSKDLQYRSTVKEAIDLALQMAGNSDLICITGSIFTASEAFDYFGKSFED